MGFGRISNHCLNNLAIYSKFPLLWDIGGGLKNLFNKKNAFDAVESLESWSSAPEPVVATMAPRYLADVSIGMRGPGALGGEGEQIGHLHCPLTTSAKCNNLTEVTLRAMHLSQLRLRPTLRA